MRPSPSSSGDRLIQEIHLKDHWADLVIPVMKQRYIELDIECNFYSVDPNQEMRGEDSHGCQCADVGGIGEKGKNGCGRDRRKSDGDI